MDNGVQPLSTLAEKGSMEESFGRVANSGGSTGRTELGTPFRGWNDNSCPSTCRRGKKSTPEAEALGRSRGGFGTKLHVRAEGNGRLLTFALTPGQQYDITMSETLLEQGAVFRKATGRKRLYPKRLIADKGYTSRKFRTFLRKHRIAVTIPHKENEHHKGVFDKVLYRTRNRVERLFARLKQFRRIATRYEKRGENFAAMITIAAIFLWSQFAYTP
jgi:transposase